MGIGQYVPWWGKLGLKLALARAPIPYSIWKRLGIFRHGDMADPHRAVGAFRSHLERSEVHRRLPRPFSMLELGPGDSVLSAGVARAYGAERSVLIDVGAFADRDTGLFHSLSMALDSFPDLPKLKLPNTDNFDDMLRELNAQYFTDGIRSFSAVEDESIDLIWSSVVLEHVRQDEFGALAAECARVLTPGGIMSHAVDLRDHLGGGLNNLRFSPERWESAWWRDAGFYTNRMSQRDIIDSFERVGFRTIQVASRRWPAPPLPRNKLHSVFRDRRDDELDIAEFDLVMVKSND
jgi:SAM-dependent methyltransferase